MPVYAGVCLRSDQTTLSEDKIMIKYKYDKI